MLCSTSECLYFTAILLNQVFNLPNPFHLLLPHPNHNPFHHKVNPSTHLLPRKTLLQNIHIQFKLTTKCFCLPLHLCNISTEGCKQQETNSLSMNNPKQRYEEKPGNFFKFEV